MRSLLDILSTQQRNYIKPDIQEIWDTGMFKEQFELTDELKAYISDSIFLENAKINYKLMLKLRDMYYEHHVYLKNVLKHYLIQNKTHIQLTRS